MKIPVFILAMMASITVCLLYVKAGNTEVAALWGATSGIWVANVVYAIMEDD